MNYILSKKGLQFHILLYIILGLIVLTIIAIQALTTEGFFDGFSDLLREIIFSS